MYCSKIVADVRTVEQVEWLSHANVLRDKTFSREDEVEMTMPGSLFLWL
jgi:hypothetical protein